MRLAMQDKKSLIKDIEWNSDLAALAAYRVEYDEPELRDHEWILALGRELVRTGVEGKALNSAAVKYIGALIVQRFEPHTKADLRENADHREWLERVREKNAALEKRAAMLNENTAAS